MRESVDAERVVGFMRALGREISSETRVYFTGGVSAVLHGWRASTNDLDVKFLPDSEAFNVLPRLKEQLQVSVELASPTDFIPTLPGWEERSEFIRLEGKVTFSHFDYYSQALAKLERGFDQDVADVREMLARQLIKTSRLREHFESIEPELKRFPAIDPATFRLAVEELLSG